MKRAMLFFLACLAFAQASADKPLDVRDVMSARQFHQTGLDTLSPEQLAALNAWLAAYTRAPAAMSASPAVAAAPAPLPAATPAPAAATAANFGSEMVQSSEHPAPDRIESRILGTFTGWNGQTVFRLENGQVWKQADSSTYDTRLENPPVVIKRLGFGYLLSLTGHGATVFVKRVQ